MKEDIVALSDEQIKNHLAYLKDALLKKNKTPIDLTSNWVKKFPNEPGCYIAYENDTIIYAGETANLSKRMRNMLDSRNHVLRRNIGESNFSSDNGFSKATTKKNFPNHIEKMLEQYLQENIKLSFIIVNLGRKELEEMLIRDFPCKYNKQRPKK